ncbi:4272_t:CDS:2, partial [Scutellospora calospora]
SFRREAVSFWAILLFTFLRGYNIKVSVVASVEVFVELSSFKELIFWLLVSAILVEDVSASSEEICISLLYEFSELKLA